MKRLESNANGFIRQTFLEGEVEEGLTVIAQQTSSLTDEANDILNQVADIVALPHLNDSDVQEGVRDARRKRDQTIADLYEFDANQTRALIAIENDLKTMETWISDIEGLFTDGVTAIDFPLDKWAALSAKNTLQSDLAQRTAGMDGVNAGQGSGDELGNLVGANTSEDERMKALYAAMEKEPSTGDQLNDNSIDPNTGEYLMTFEGKRKVLGGNGTGTIDGLAPYAMAIYDFYLGDIGTMLSPDASGSEILEAALFTIVKPLNLADTGRDILKVGETGKLPVKTGGKIQIVDGEKQYNVNGISPKKVEKDTGNADHPIRTYRNGDLSKLERKYSADSKIIIEMPYVGKGKKGTNAEGWLRNKDFYWKEILNKNFESISKINKQKIELGFSPINDKKFREYFPQYDIKELYNDTLIHHHVGGGGQAVAVPSKLHPGTGGIHNAEKAAGIWGNDNEYAISLEKFLNK
nr:T7SS effector LXG polymorphic toxin [Sporosarcina sp. ANT_H38]